MKKYWLNNLELTEVQTGESFDRFLIDLSDSNVLFLKKMSFSVEGFYFNFFQKGYVYF